MLKVAYPSLPLLAEGVHTLMTKSLATIPGSHLLVRRENEIIDVAEIEVPDYAQFLDEWLIRIRESGERIASSKINPLAGREYLNLFATKSRKIRMFFEKHKMPLPDKGEVKLYNWLSETVFKNLASLLYPLARNEAEFTNIFGRDWKIVVARGRAPRLIVALDPKGPLLPLLVRSLSFYEQGRFFGLRDLKERGGVSTGSIEVRGDEIWFLFALMAVSNMLIGRYPVGPRDFRDIFVGVRLEPERTYTHHDLAPVNGLATEAENVIRKAPLLEDPEMLKLILVFRLYERAAEEYGFIETPASLVIYALSPTGNRYTATFYLEIPLTELGLVHYALESRFKGNEIPVALSLAELGVILARIFKFQKTGDIPIDRLVVLYKVICYGILEPTYSPPLEYVYELARIWEQRDAREALLKAVTRQLINIRGISKEKARERALSLWEKVLELSSRIVS